MSFSPALETVYNAQLRETPEYKSSLDKRLADCDAGEMEMVNHLAEMIIRLTGDDLPQFCRDYKWICDVVLEEEMHFRRNGEYRLKTFDEANAEVYSVPEKMTPYMNGLLMTQLWWANHTESIAFLKDRFLPSMPDKYDVLEVGPGHGLLLSYPALDPRCNHLEAWDLSDASLAATQLSLNNIGVTKDVTLRFQDLYEADPKARTFDGIIFSEVLEHLEEPAQALLKLKSVLKPGGRIYIHIPINSPAPDHIFNLDNPDDVVAFIEKSGLKVIDKEFVPMNGYTQEQAIRMKLTISCLIIAERTD